ncbi:host cell division inhibitor Icd-like protein [Pasteurella caecimuris]|uniref:host cell division inhibitor Icd-like protein n=1 Tax=Rodentibacter caecimuris TaxID=1796644 RepID=UPI0021501688|nr:host cell division inhibitor Icd-like protein [Pasteurella caecimuris]MCR1837663.1 host cell division inhibitor Icd-like protein [Pasteurella caecimuris]MCU0106653.1 host cell division inhibitor Icd-like protein [Pasteurella caecimuris]
MKNQKQAGLFSAPTPKSPLSSFSQASKTMTNSHSNKIFSFFAKNALQTAVNFGIISTQSQKTIAEPQNSNDKQLANSTPLACFFIRSTRTPKERLESLEPQERLSMVACNGKGFALCCVPIVAVSEPVTRYRPSLRTLAVTSIKYTIGAIKMLFKFLCVNRTQAHFNLCVISLYSTTEEQARLGLSADFRHIATVARINPKNDCNFKGGIYA